MIFENSSPHRNFGKKKVKYEISILSSDSRYFWSVALNILLRCFNVATYKEPPLHLTLTDFLQVPFIERTLMQQLEQKER